MKLYTLGEIAHALPFDRKYNLFLVDEEHGDICLNKTWSEMHEILSHGWWSLNTKLDNIVLFNDTINIFLRRGDNA